MLRQADVVVFLLAAVACGGGSSSTPTGMPTTPSGSSSPTNVTFSASPELAGVHAGAPVFYSFCKPDITGNDLCQNSTNPV
jgi:hypothetical protein